jgi:rhodanese-related sulfurtransferase
MIHAMLIDTETLQQNLGQPGLVILDVRGRAAYEFGGHIPGAVHSTWHEYSDPHAVPKGLLDPDRGRMEQKIRALGISQDSEVVIYSNPFDNWGDEGRMFWMLEYLGHTRLRILDGGWVKWVQEKRPFEHGPVTPKPREAAASEHRDRRCAQPRRISWERGVGNTATRPYSLRDSPGLEWISSRKCHGEKSGNDHRESSRERSYTGSRGHLLLHRRCPFSLAVFYPQTRRIS